MQDVELTPKLYKTPVQVRSRELSTPVMENLYNNINAYFHIVSIETDNDVLGFEALSDVDVKRFFKYDVTFMVTNTNANDILATGEPLCNILLQLTEQMITINRTYTKLIEVLGDVGGLMEFIFSFFKILAIFVTNTLYEKSLINNLFSFDIDKKIILIKNQKKSKKNEFTSKDEPAIYTPMRPINKLSSISIENDETIRSKGKINETNRNKFRSDMNLVPSKLNISRRHRFKVKTSLSLNNVEIGNVIDKKNNAENNEIEQEINKDYIDKNMNTERDNRRTINKIKLSKVDIYLCFFCTRKRKNIQNALIDEGMNMISEKLDIINLFIKLHRDEIIQEKINKEDIIEMSDKCKIDIQKIYFSFYSG